MTHVDSLAIFPAAVAKRTHIGGCPADVTAANERPGSVTTTETKFFFPSFSLADFPRPARTAELRGQRERRHPLLSP